MKNKSLWVIVMVILLNQIAFGWGGPTHKLLSLKAIDNSMLGKDFDLLYRFGFTFRWNTSFLFDNSAYSFRELVGYGAINEDDAWALGVLKSRSDNHFHNPQKTFDEAFLTDIELTWGNPLSSILWAQNQPIQEEYVQGNNTWQFARDELFGGITATEISQRNQHFANMFKALGHQIHLIEDMAVPDHVRNDSHYEKDLWGAGEGGALKYGEYRCIEYWALHNESLVYQYSDLCEKPDDSLLKGEAVGAPSGYTLRPISRLVDINALKHNSFLESGTVAGLAEYTNSNFFSENTIPFDDPSEKHSFLFPRSEALEKVKVLRKIGDWDYYARYYNKVGEGEKVDYFLRRDTIWGLLQNDSGFLDAKSHEAYAAKLIPKAVGYSAAMLDYFFRGKLEVALPDDGVFSFIDENNTAFTRIKLKVRNVTPDEKLVSNGTMQLIVRYREAPGAPLEYDVSPAIDWEIEEKYILANVDYKETVEEPCEEYEEVEFILDPGLPLNAVDISFSVACRGKVGEEMGSVAYGYLKVSEPTAITLVNNSDKVCFQGNFVANSDPNLIAAVDTDQNGIVECSKGEESINPYKVIVKNIAFNGKIASDTNYQIKYDAGVEMLPSDTFTVYAIGNTDNIRFSVQDVTIDMTDPTWCRYYSQEEVFDMKPYASSLSWFFSNEWLLYQHRSSTQTIRGIRAFDAIIYNHYIPIECECDFGEVSDMSSMSQQNVNSLGQKIEIGRVFQKRKLRL